MPLLTAGGFRHFYRFEGNDDRPVLMLAHSLGNDHSMWDAQAAALLPHFRVLRYDVRGHGASDAPPGDYSIEMLAREMTVELQAIRDSIGPGRSSPLTAKGVHFGTLSRGEDGRARAHPAAGRGGCR